MINRTYHIFIECRPQIYNERVAAKEIVRGSSIVHYRSFLPNHDDVLIDAFERLCNKLDVDTDDFMVINFARVG